MGEDHPTQMEADHLVENPQDHRDPPEDLQTLLDPQTLLTHGKGIRIGIMGRTTAIVAMNIKEDEARLVTPTTTRKST